MKPQDQYKILKKHFGGKFVDIGLEGYVIPKLDKLFTGNYPNAVQKVLDSIESTRPFYNWRKGQIDDNHLRRAEQTQKALETLYKAQKGDYIVIPAQLGTKYKGKSVEQARKDFDTNEFGLGAFEVGCILLTHPDTIKSYDDLYLDCAGDEFSPDAVGVFSSAPNFNWGGGKLRFDTYWLYEANDFFGAVSGFVSQPNLESGNLETFESLGLEQRVARIENWINQWENYDSGWNKKS